jgi:hypothetical protein
MRIEGADGKPIDRANVSFALAADAGDKPASEWRGLPSYRRERSRSGTVEVDGLSSGSWVYSVTARDHQEARGRLYVTPGDVPMTELISLKPVEKKATPGKPASGDVKKQNGK